MGSIPKSTGSNPHERCPLGFNPNRGTCVNLKEGHERGHGFESSPKKEHGFEPGGDHSGSHPREGHGRESPSKYLLKSHNSYSANTLEVHFSADKCEIEDHIEN